MTTTSHKMRDANLNGHVLANDDPADRDWIPLCWTDEARETPELYQFGEQVESK